MSLTSIVG
ncbi:TPA: hypothetical protein N0F65_007319 [Lagenidium giganteum]|uniref:Uncharacterized protein n=1 Tax=Lagenidium giganteum TaxID=4803 RepID=A0AAV2Z7L5_9STRA|nr:TPA: hypothetical protein N0F65_007319 [Lagenidium giganteum]